MASVKVLLVTIFVLSLFSMCSGCVSVERDRRDNHHDEWRQQQSEHERSDQDRDKNSEERHEDKHDERH